MKRFALLMAIFAVSCVANAATQDATFDCSQIKEKKVRLSCEQAAKKAAPIDQKAAAQSKFVEKAKSSVAEKMLDPSSVQFRNLTYVDSALRKEGDPIRHVLCGEINAKNSFGGYIGFKLFFVDAGSNYPDSLNSMVCSGGDNQKICLMSVEGFCTKAVREVVEIPNS